MDERIDGKLMDEFLGCVLDCYKDGTKSRPSAIGIIGHILYGMNLPRDVASDPNHYMRAVLAELRTSKNFAKSGNETGGLLR
jgi:hypothetical protein